MAARKKQTARTEESRARLLGAAVDLIRAKGYSATTVDDICAASSLSKGAFFHHFESKEACALAAAGCFVFRADERFDNAPFMKLDDPRARVLAYIDFRKSILRGAPAEFTCLLGTIVQEAYETHPALRDACGAHIEDHAQRVAADLAAAKALYAPGADWSPQSVAIFTQAVLQGAFVLAKAKHGADVAAGCLDQLRDYVERLLPPAGADRRTAKRAQRPKSAAEKRRRSSSTRQ
jgi:TetR/AcrR family transcriptional regulator, transcriptional repressor for nem operon